MLCDTERGKKKKSSGDKKETELHPALAVSEN